jgi:signal-transduction protein with cAMP-binding, CBS, and nucleotidyltransferase domain
MRGAALEGIVSERDYARKVILRGRSSADTPVRDIMSSPVLSVSLETSVQQCMQLMTDRRVRHLPVIEDARVVGMVSIGDLVKAVIAEQQQQIEQLESYIHS